MKKTKVSFFFPPEFLVVVFILTIEFKFLGDLPGLDFSQHCNSRFAGIYPTYLKCDEIALDIEACQLAGKKVLLSLGGGIHWNGFADVEQARLFAHNIWNLFLGGDYKIRSFGRYIFFLNIKRLVLDLLCGDHKDL